MLDLSTVVLNFFHMIMKSFFFADRLNFLTYLVNVGNAVVAFAIVIIWCVTKSGEKAAWMKVIEHMNTTLYTIHIHFINH